MPNISHSFTFSLTNKPKMRFSKVFLLCFSPWYLLQFLFKWSTPQVLFNYRKLHIFHLFQHLFFNFFVAYVDFSKHKAEGACSEPRAYNSLHLHRLGYSCCWRLRTHFSKVHKISCGPHLPKQQGATFKFWIYSSKRDPWVNFKVRNLQIFFLCQCSMREYFGLFRVLWVAKTREIIILVLQHPTGQLGWGFSWNLLVDCFLFLHECRNSYLWFFIDVAFLFLRFW